MFLFRFITILICCLSSSHLFSQELRVKPLGIGDKAPDIRFNKVLNYSATNARLSDFKGKLVILDMWSTWCTSCIAAFPKMDKLQAKFGKDIQILLVNAYHSKNDSEDRIKTVLNRLKQRSGFYPSLPIPIHDTLLNSYFPHKSVPHQVWINSKGIIIGITSSNEVNEKNIQDAISEEKISFVLKNDWAFDKEVPFLVANNGDRPNDFIYRSIFTGYRSGMGIHEGIRLNDRNEITGLYMINVPLRYLMMSAYEDSIKGIPLSRFVFDVSNHQKFRMLDNDTANSYCYDLTIIPVKRMDVDLQLYMKDDLKKAFNLSLKREMRRLNSLIVTLRAESFNGHSNFGKSEADLEDQTIKKFFHRVPIKEIIEAIALRLHRPLLDETGVSEEKIDIDFPDRFDLSDEKAVIEALKRAGFDVKEEEREMEVVVITDK